ncbi:MAG: HAD-IA family hydrolase [Candidatus Zixiibacteriota bacterium]
MVHTVFFDIGGTLVTGTSGLHMLAKRLDASRESEIFQSLRNDFMDIYLDESPVRFYTIKEILALTAQKTAARFGLPDVSDEVVELYRTAYLKQGYMYDDTVETLRRLKANGINIVLISDADDDVLVTQLKNFGIWDYFDHTIISSITKAYKPADKVVAKALEYSAEPLSGILFVGDTIVDIKMAKKMNVKSVLINRDNNFKLEADYKITGLDQLFNIIVELKEKQRE